MDEGLRFGGNEQQQQQQHPTASSPDDPLMGYRPEELEAYADSLQQQQQQANGEKILNNYKYAEYDDDSPALEQDEENDDALFLDPDLYVKSRERINPDGSIRQSDNADDDDSHWDATIDQKYREVLQKYMETIPVVPDTFEDATAGSQSDAGVNRNRNDAKNEPTMDDLWNLLRQRGPHPYDAATAEELHRQVFAEEEGHLQQSPVFRESLLDGGKAEAAAAERRGRAFRQRQEETLRQLEREMEEFENTTLPTLPTLPSLQPAPETTTAMEKNEPKQQEQLEQQQQCSKCRCLLSNKELSAARLRQRHESSFLCRVCYRQDVLLVAASRQNSRQLEPENSRSGRLSPNNDTTTTNNNNGSKIPAAVWTNQLSNSTLYRSSLHIRPPVSVPEPIATPPQQQPTTVQGTSNNAAAISTTASRELPDDNSPWLAVVDPDTKEVFYWNEETGEMCWELDDD